MHALTRTAITHGLRPIVTPTTDLDTMTEKELCALALKKWPHLATVADDDNDDDTCGYCHGGADREHPCPQCGTTGYVRRHRDDGEYDEDYCRDRYRDD